MRRCPCGRQMRSKIHDRCRVCRTGQLTASERGYDRAHTLERERWRRVVEAGEGQCAQPECVRDERWIDPRGPWDLGHNDERTGWIGPVHVDCNRRDGAQKTERIIAAKHGRRARTYATVPSQAAPWNSRKWI